jgi:hypothetical protein
MSGKSRLLDANERASKHPALKTPAPRDGREMQRQAVQRAALSQEGPPPAAMLKPDDILYLQQTIGNQAVQQLLTPTQDGDAPPAAPPVQAKLNVGSPGDRYEQEADRIADAVVSRMRTDESHAAQGDSGAEVEEEFQATPRLQRQTGAGESSAGARQEASIQSARGGGQPIADNVRAPVERATGVNLSGVRVHDNAEADTLNRSLSARAFTTGSDIFFKSGEYNPGSTEGQKLLAHELTHVVQQTGGNEVVQRAVTHTTGKQVDTYLNASPFIKTYVEAKFKAGTKAEGHVHIHTPAEFVKAWVKYSMGRKNPDTGKVFTEEEAKKWEPNVNAFRDGTEIHVHQDRGETGTAIHESIHLFGSDSYRDKLGFNANEGTTEYFTRMVCAEQKIARGSFYVSERKSIEKLVTVTTKETLAAAFFQGKVDDLEKAVEGKAKGTFAKWVGFMQGKKYSDADALL